MITTCSNCHSKYEVPDKMLGRQARCKGCSKMFLIAPAEGTNKPKPEKDNETFTPPKRTGSTAQLRPVHPQETQTRDDPLDALANAASGDDPRQRLAPRADAGYRDRYEEDRPIRSRRAKGAGSAMGMGIASVIFAVLASVCGLITMLSGDNKNLITIIGPITILLVVITTALAMMAVFNGTSASRKIRRARHPLGGQSQASTGTITGSIALLLSFALLLACTIWLINRGGLNFEEVIIEGRGQE